MSLYLDHFGLREAPYRITPHTEFFYDGANRGATLDALVYAIVHDEGIVKVTGEVGSGKTMLCRMLLERLPATVETIYFANPSLNRDELLLALADELQLPAPPAHTHQLLRALQQHLVSLHQAGKQVVVLIDEAHAMPAESLEEIRLLSNLETQRSKLLQIVLFGQPELNAILGTQEMRQLRERITHNFFLEPLKQPDVATYLIFRLRAAGYHGPDIFAPAAIKRFSEVSHGLTRRLNILADKALLAAFARNTHLIDLNVANIAVADAHFDDTGVTRRDGSSGKRRSPWLAAGLAASAAALLLTGWLAGRSDAPPTSNFIASAVSEPARPAAKATPPAAAPAPSVGSAAATKATPTPVAAQNSAPEVAKSGVPAEKLQVAAPIDAAVRRPLLADHRARFNDWIRAADGRHYSIQLLRVPAHHTASAEDFLHRATAATEPSSLYVYEAKAGNQDWIGVVYGDFASATDAEQMLAALPSALRSHQPFVRPIRQLKP